MACISDLYLSSLLSVWLSSSQPVGILFLILAFTALQYLVVEYCKRNQWGRSWGATTSQEPWFWQDISWASGFEDNWFSKSSHMSSTPSSSTLFWVMLHSATFLLFMHDEHCLCFTSMPPWIRYFYCSHKYCVLYFGVSVGWYLQDSDL